MKGEVKDQSENLRQGNMPKAHPFPWLVLSSVQFSCSVMSDSLTPWITRRQASLSITKSWSSPKPTSIESVMPSNHLILCHPFLLPPTIFPRFRVFSNESTLRIRWPKHWSFSFSISPSNEYWFPLGSIGLISLQFKGLKSPLQCHNSKASILQCLAFFMSSSQSIHDYWKNHSFD